MMYGDAQQQQSGDFHRGPPPSPMMRQPSASSTNLSSAEYHYPPPSAHHPPYDAQGDNFAAKRMRKLTHRRAVDYTSTVVRFSQIRMCQRDLRDRTVLQPTTAAAIDMLPTVAYSDNPSTSFSAKFVHTSLNKNRCSINRVLWTPTGRRLITGSQSGEFTLWNGQSFNFEMILQAHDQAIRSMVWSHNDNWMVSGDDGGAIKYWQNNMNNVKANKSAHKESVRDLSFCKTDLKFCSCSDDTTVKVWDFARCQEERSLSGHGWDVKSVDWHPTKSLLVSGGKDNLVKLWDAKSGRELCSFHGHKNVVLCVKWNQNGNWVLTSSKDQIIKLYDIRSMKELESFRGHWKDVTALAWHPFHEEYFVSGSFDGSIFHWLVGHGTPQVEIPNAHDNSVWDLAWHPTGYLLSSGSNDHTTKFWCRNRPGDIAREKFNAGFGDSNPPLSSRLNGSYPVAEGSTTPALFAPGLIRNEGTIPGVGVALPLSMPSLDASSPGEQKQSHLVSMPLGAPPLPPGPHPSLAVNQQQPYQQNPQHQQPYQQNPQHQQPYQQNPQQQQPYQHNPQQQQPYQRNPQQQQQQQQQQQHHQGHPQQMPPVPLPPPNMPQLQPSSHLPLLPHQLLPQRPQQVPPLGMPSSIPSSIPGSLPMPSSVPLSITIQMPGPIGVQGTMNQMVPPTQQSHFRGMNQMHSSSLPSSGATPSFGGFMNGLPNMQGPANVGMGPMYPQGGAFNRAQVGQMPMMPGYNPYQSNSLSGMPQPPQRAQPPQ